MKTGLKALRSVMGVALLAALPVGVEAAAVRTGFDTATLPRNDDGSTTAVSIGFNINFFGTTRNTLFVNNNGNLTFTSSLSAYSPNPLAQSATGTGGMIAPFWADVDTRNTASGVTAYGTGTVNGRPAFGASWRNVGYFSSRVDKLNTFQVILVERNDTGTGNFDIEFNYDSITWETGDASGGTNGLGGTAARVGYADGTGVAASAFELPGSGTPGAFLNTNQFTALATHARNSSVLGRYVFVVRNGRAAEVQVTIDDRTAVEGTNAGFRVTLDVPPSANVTVNYTAASGTATSGTDFTATSGVLTFTPGRTWHSIMVPLIADSLTEGNETFTVTLSSPSANALLARATATGTITDPPTPARLLMYRAYNRTADYHFFTTSFVEFASAVAAGYGDESSGRTGFYVANTQLTGTAAINRMYNPNTGRHYYTANAGERDSLQNIGWAYEKTEGYIFLSQVAETTTIFRLYNNNSGVHLYTENQATRNSILATFPGIWVEHTPLGFAYTAP